jgi:hypothetical protein
MLAAAWSQSVSSDPDERIEIDFDRTETEAGWIRVIDRFGLRAAPTWFNWLGWMLALGALQFFHTKSDSAALGVVLAISYGLLWLYFWGFFFRIKIKGLPLLNRPSVARLASVIVSGALAFIAWRIATMVAREIARFQQTN